MQKEEHELKRAGAGLLSWRDPAQNNFKNSQTTQRLTATGELSAVAKAGGTPCKVVNRIVVSMRRKKAKDLSSRSFRIQTHS